MDYEHFKSVIGDDMDVPTPQQTESLVEGDMSIHLRVCMGYQLITGECVARDIVDGGEKILNSMAILEDRGAKRGQDYIITAHVNQGMVFCTLHTTRLFLSEEDI